MVLIGVLLDDDQLITVLGLALCRVHGDNTQYERVGFIAVQPMQSNRFESWIAD